MVTFINTARQMGKTTMIIKEMKKNPKAVMVVATERMAEFAIKNNPELKDRIVSIGQYRDHKFDSRRFEEAHFDDIESMIGVKHKVGFMTITNYPGID